MALSSLLVDHCLDAPGGGLRQVQPLRYLLELVGRLVARQLAAQTANLPDLARVELVALRLELLQALDLGRHLLLHVGGRRRSGRRGRLRHPDPPELGVALPLGLLLAGPVLGEVLVVEALLLALAVVGDEEAVDLPEGLGVGALVDERVAGLGGPALVASDADGVHHGADVGADHVRLPLRPLRDGVQAVGLPFVVELGLDDGEEALVELEEGLDLALVLAVELPLLLDLVEGGLDGPLQLSVLAEHRLHCQ